MIQNVLAVLGGVAIFIYGMTLMSDGLQKVAGTKMRSILRLFARNRYVAVLTAPGSHASSSRRRPPPSWSWALSTPDC